MHPYRNRPATYVPAAPTVGSGTPSNWRAPLMAAVRLAQACGALPASVGAAMGAVTAGTPRTAAAQVAQALYCAAGHHYRWCSGVYQATGTWPAKPAQGYTPPPACTQPATMATVQALYPQLAALSRQAGTRRVLRLRLQPPAHPYNPAGWQPALQAALHTLGGVLASMAGAVCRAQWARPLGYGKPHRTTMGVTSPRTTAQLAAYWHGTQPGTR